MAGAARVGHPPRLNTTAPLDLAWVLEPGPEDAAVARVVEDLPSRSIPAPDAEPGLLLHATRTIDLTTLAGDDTPERVRALCAQARDPLPPSLAGALGVSPGQARVAAVCVYHYFLEVALRALEGSGIPVAVAAAGFPAGLSPLRQRVDEVRAAVAAGAGEIDVVINRSLVLTGEWEALYDEVGAFRDAAGAVPLKVILATGELGSLENVTRAARLCILAGADFIKTSTGKEAVNATYPAGLVMLRVIRDHFDRTGKVVGFKPAGGIRTPPQALEWTQLVREELGEEWIGPDRFRLGASGLLGEIVRRLEEVAGN